MSPTSPGARTPCGLAWVGNGQVRNDDVGPAAAVAVVRLRAAHRRELVAGVQNVPRPTGSIESEWVPLGARPVAAEPARRCARKGHIRRPGLTIEWTVRCSRLRE